MKFMITHDIVNNCLTAVLTIDFWDYVAAKFSDSDRLFLKECEESGKIADKLLALEMIARRIEEAQVCHTLS